jgi:hypothetical protein
LCSVQCTHGARIVETQADVVGDGMHEPLPAKSCSPNNEQGWVLAHLISEEMLTKMQFTHYSYQKLCQKIAQRIQLAFVFLTNFVKVFHYNN